MVAGETAAEVHKDFGPAGFHLGRFGGQKKRNGPRKELLKNPDVKKNKKNFHLLF